MWGISNAHLMNEHVHASGTHHALSFSMRRDDEMQPMSRLSSALKSRLIRM